MSKFWAAAGSDDSSSSSGSSDDSSNSSDSSAGGGGAGGGGGRGDANRWVMESDSGECVCCYKVVKEEIDKNPIVR
jgi:hypothetical protein